LPQRCMMNRKSNLEALGIGKQRRRPTKIDEASSSESGAGATKMNQSSSKRWRLSYAARQRLSVLLCWASGFNLALMLAILALLLIVSERWRLSTYLVYLPRAILLAPAMALLAGVLFYRREGYFWRFAVLANCTSLLLVAAPIMGLVVHLPQFSSSNAPAEEFLRIVSCNVSRDRPSIESVSSQIHRSLPDLILLQGAEKEHEQFAKSLQDYRHLYRDGFVFAARFPVRHLGTFHSQEFGRVAAAAFSVEHPAGEFRVFGVRQSGFGFPGWDKVDEQTRLRQDETRALRAFVEEHRGAAPIIIAGDFGMPSDSSLYKDNWKDLTNAFDRVGWGYGYSAPSGQIDYWPDSSPWLRRDHIMTCNRWRADNCWTISTTGSEHRQILAVLRRR
jgi:vancomycin resistance protein VanJ